LYSRRSVWEEMDAVIFQEDKSIKERVDEYDYLHELCERLLRALALKLNTIHGVHHELRYWRILLAPWIYFFVPCLRDRWNSIQAVLRNYDISGTVFLDMDKKYFVPQGPHDMVDCMVGDDWNHAIYRLLLNYCGLYGDVSDVGAISESRGVIRDRASISLKRRVRDGLGRALQSLSRDDDIFISHSYLSFISEKFLELRLGQCPQLWKDENSALLADVNFRTRNWSLICDATNDFESFLLNHLSQFLPVCYMEGYGRLCEIAATVPWPIKPKVIFTSNDLWYNTVAMAYSADKVEQGSRLVYGQHGGHYGMGLKKWMEEHEIRIADRYLTWGWKEAEALSNRAKVLPVGVLKKVKTRSFGRFKGDLLFIVVSGPRYRLRLDIDGDVLPYVHPCLGFADALAGSRVYDSLLIRLYSHEYGWNENDRWRDAHPCVRLDAGRKPIWDLVKESKLVVYSYNSTGYLEFFAANIPCIVLFEETRSPLREAAKPYFDELRRVGIYHESPESAANHIKSIWGDVPGWWNSSDVQDALRIFKHQYCLRPNKLLSKVTNILQEITTLQE